MSKLMKSRVDLVAGVTLGHEAGRLRKFLFIFSPHHSSALCGQESYEVVQSWH